MFLNAHVEMESAIDAYLDVYEAIHRSSRSRACTGILAPDQVTETQLARMKRLGMYAGLHSRPAHPGRAHAQGARRARVDMPLSGACRTRHRLGLGSDATAVTTSNPFYTLWFAVTGRMVGGRKVNRQTITREEALIAHTRSNARFIFQEAISFDPAGKYADL